MPKRRVVIGLLGSTLDAGLASARWGRWRPSVAICQHPELPIDRFELLVSAASERLVEQVIADIAEASPATEVRRHAFAVTDAWDFSEVYAALADFADRYRWQPDREEYLLHITTGTHVMQICLFLLCETRLMPARLLQSSPPRAGNREQRVTAGPAGRVDVIDLDLTKYDHLAARFVARRARGESLLKAGIATSSPAFNHMIEQLEQVATRSKDPLLLTGETGTGKSALCQRVFELKRERQHLGGELVAVNCATLRGDTAASALFGHARGAFTGAAEARAGFLRKADKGLLFLDEIGELGRDEQAMLLLAIEEKRFYPVGSDKQVSSDFQLVIGTNRDLWAEVRAGRFREDLLARVSVWSFELPPLRARREDLAPNLDYELDRLSVELGHPVSMSSAARTAFLRFAEAAAWPANFREFNAAVRRMVTLSDGGRVAEGGVHQEVARLQAAWLGPAHRERSGGLVGARREGGGGDLDGAAGGASEAMASGERDDGVRRLAALLGDRLDALDRFDRAQLVEVARVCAVATSLSAAGRILFAQSIKGRTTRNDADRLRKYLARFELTFEALHRGEPRP
jgi:transcriptional regulatory protein RtcR